MARRKKVTHQFKSRIRDNQREMICRNSIADESYFAWEHLKTIGRCNRWTKVSDQTTAVLCSKCTCKTVPPPEIRKGYVSKGLFGIPKTVNVSAHGLKVINQDRELTRILKQYGFGTDLDDMPEDLFRQLTDPGYKDYSGVRSRGKEITASRQKLYMNGRLGMIIDGTGHKYNKIREQKM